MRRIAAGLAALLALALPAAGDVVPVEITPRAIERFEARSDETRFGQLDYVGGFSFRGSDRRLAGISGFRFRDGEGSAFLAVTDTGLWFEGRIERDGDGRPVGMSEAAIAPILGPNGEARMRKGDADAEGIAIDGDRVLVAFEQRARVEEFDARDPLRSPAREVAQPIPVHELRRNQGLETIARAPDGRIVVVSENSIDSAGNLFAGILGQGVFTVTRQEPWMATDGAFLEGGDLLLLERRYEGFGRVGMRIRRIEGRTIEVGALVDGPVVMEASLAQEIDNMEGLDVFVNAAGETIVALVSDDNASFFQRNLYLEFRLIEDASPPS